ncbi:MAG: DUF4160 domain-containing protein [Mogibacterium sp.]|nr:DUF4160 domain-containing protein [Mogibacterium sp.]
MPIISRFNGIVIRMYFQQSEHNPPHVHAYYGNSVAAISISDAKILEGSLPPKALDIVKQWIKTNSTELMDIWNTQIFRYIPPLE